MCEPVVSDTANLLTRALYYRLLREVAERAGQSREPQSLDWARLVVAARDKLARSHKDLAKTEAAASTKEWTLPVLYLRPDTFELVVAPAPPEPELTIDARGPQRDRVVEDVAGRAVRLEIGALRSLLDSLPPDQAPALHAEALDRIAQLAARLGVQVAQLDDVAPSSGRSGRRLDRPHPLRRVHGHRRRVGTVRRQRDAVGAHEPRHGRADHAPGGPRSRGLASPGGRLGTHPA
jgi:hypothetical protein